MNNKLEETQMLTPSAEDVHNGNLSNVAWTDENGALIENVKEYFEQESENLVQQGLKKYSPIGTVVRLREAIFLYMIIGYKYYQNGSVFDYVAVQYPCGTTNNAPTYVFNHDEITQFHHIGMQHNIQKAFKEKLLEEDGL